MISKTPIPIMNIKQIVDELGLSMVSNDFLLLRSSFDDISSIEDYPFRSPHYSLIYIAAGRIKVKVNMFDYKLEQGQMLLVAPVAIRSFVSCSVNAEIRAVLFTDDYVANAQVSQSSKEVYNFCLSNTHFVLNLSLTDSDDVKDIYRLLFSQSSLYRERQKVVELLFFSLLNLLGNVIKTSTDILPKETKSRKANLALHFFQLLPKHIHREREVNYYADQLHVNPKYLSRVLGELAGKPASLLIAEMLILEARVLLSNSHLSIGEVALELGFSDQFIFSKYFKHHTGLTPSAYRKSFQHS